MVSNLLTDADRIRAFRRQCANLAKMIDWPFEDKMERASGLCVCELCSLPYHDHPHENGLTLTCDGRLWKL